MRMWVRKLVVCTAITCAMGVVNSSEVTADPIRFPIVRDGQPVVRVVVGTEHPVLAAAVKDLQTYVEKISGAKLDVVQGKDDLPGPTLHVGETALYGRTEPARQAMRKYDGFAVVPVGEDLIVAGTMPQGTANGLWTLIQDQFGVRWYYPGDLWEVVPEAKSLTVSLELNAPGDFYLEEPTFFERSLWGGGRESPFGRRMRLSQQGVPFPHVGTGHAISRFFNSETYGDHPEYFAYWDGERHVGHDVHPCYTHPDMFEIFMNYVREGGSGLGVNDNHTACKCERCLKIDGDSEPYLGMYNVSESYFQLIARVARQTAKEKPTHRLGVFAYQITNAPPKTVEHIGENVSVVLCQDTAQYFDEAVRKQDMEMSAEWVKKCGHVRFYDYIGINFWTPRYFPHILADQMRHLGQIGVSGYGTHHVTMTDSSMPMFYLLYQLLWNAELDADQVIGEMMTNLYAEASGPVSAFYDHWEKCWERQEEGRWFWGMDNFRGEMEIYTWEDIVRGKELLDEAARLARDEKVKQRVDFLRDRFAFTCASAQAHFVSAAAIDWEPTGNYEQAIRVSNGVVDAWRNWAGVLDRAKHLNDIPVGGWISKTGRVRAWGLKQQMRDAVVAPLIRWICANEGRIPPSELREAERVFAGVGLVNRHEVEQRVIDDIGAARRTPRTDQLRVPDIPRIRDVPELGATYHDWPGVPVIDAIPWMFRLRPEHQDIGKYDEPMPQNYVETPTREDHSMRWQAAWDHERLYIHLRVQDDIHEQGQPAEAMWKQDSVQIALNPERWEFVAPNHSWLYIWAGYRGPEAEFGVSLHGEDTDVHVWETPESLAEDVDASSLIRAKAFRHGTYTTYDIAIDWALVPDFDPGIEKSIGICLTVNDAEKGRRRSAEYGSGIARVKRPTEFTALRLVD